MKLRVPKHAKPGECAVTPDELAEYAEGLVCLTGGERWTAGEKRLTTETQRDAEKAQRTSGMVG